MKHVFSDMLGAEWMPGWQAYAVTCTGEPGETYELGEEVRVENSDFYMTGTVSGLMNRGGGFFLEVLIPEGKFR